MADAGNELSDLQINQLIDYYDLLIEWNSFMNLTAITEFNDVVMKHFVDSLAPLTDKAFKFKKIQVLLMSVPAQAFLAFL